MRFYYFSVFSWIAYGIIVAIGIGTLWLLWTKALKFGIKNLAFWILVVTILILPWAEELWIASAFGRACQTAGTSIYGKVKADGFYDDTTHWWRQLGESRFRFVESRDHMTGKLWRAERDGVDVRHFIINQPTARYHYRWPNRNISVAHKVYQQVEELVDTQQGNVVAKATQFGRTGSWLFISLGDPGMTCPELGGRPSALLYELAIEPTDLGKEK